jgi:hypothetical protein
MQAVNQPRSSPQFNFFAVDQHASFLDRFAIITADEASSDIFDLVAAIQHVDLIVPQIAPPIPQGATRPQPRVIKCQLSRPNYDCPSRSPQSAEIY